MIKLKQLILEYVSNPIIQLGNYLKSTDSEKATELAFNLTSEVFDWAELNDIDIPKGIEEPNDFVEYLYSHDKEKFDNYASYIYKRYLKGSIEISYIGNGYPTWNYLRFQQYIKNQWLIHFSDNAVDIWRSQKFKYGVDDYTNLGLTSYIGNESKKSGGYNFAFLLSDYQKYGKAGHGGRSGWKYGKEAVVFRASGIKAWHNGDEEPQVIFWGETANDIVLLEYDKNSGDWMVTNTNTSRVIYKTEKLDDVVVWVVKNFEQYKKVLLP